MSSLVSGDTGSGANAHSMGLIVAGGQLALMTLSLRRTGGRMVELRLCRRTRVPGGHWTRGGRSQWHCCAGAMVVKLGRIVDPVRCQRC